MSAPRLLDLFSGAGGSAVGYAQAGFDVTGVDHRPQPRYPFAFVEADALEYLAAHGSEYDAIHASPPCQAYTSLRARHPLKDYPDLLGAARALLVRSGRPWVIENVPGAPIHSGISLCGGMFGLRVYRHRWFETPFYLFQPQHSKHTVFVQAKGQGDVKAHYLAGGHVTITGHVGSYCGPAMGIDWMTGNELSQAIPPAYTRFIGAALMEVLASAMDPLTPSHNQEPARPVGV